jgi:hypothetical protein
MKQVTLKQVFEEYQTTLPKLVDDREAVCLLALGSVHILGYSPRGLTGFFTRLMTDYGYLSEQDAHQELEKRVLQVYDTHHQNNLGGILASAQQTLTGGQREHAYALTAQLLYNVEPERQRVSAYLQELAATLELPVPTAEKINSWAESQPLQDEFKSRHAHGKESEVDAKPDEETDNQDPEFDRDFFEKLVVYFADKPKTDEELLQIVVDFFQHEGWPVHIEEELLRVFTTYQGKNAQFNMVVRLRAAYNQLVCYSLFPQAIPAPRRNAVATFLTMANYGTIIGNFEMDFKDGEVRYKTSVDFQSIDLEAPLLQNIIYPNVMTMDRYISGIFALIYSDRDPQDVLADIERKAR